MQNPSPVLKWPPSVLLTCTPLSPPSGQCLLECHAIQPTLVTFSMKKHLCVRQSSAWPSFFDIAQFLRFSICFVLGPWPTVLQSISTTWFIALPHSLPIGTCSRPCLDGLRLYLSTRSTCRLSLQPPEDDKNKKHEQVSRESTKNYTIPFA